ncbi:hypothetical protein BB559_004551 [Furculomyces boomerangus]|uniref:Uncharacterized protein n=2 Tax=Harpellales TaxID=61421 RepID=A0A2T9YE35_9FUNG|nr:hypothetical protein BB559_004551 [Furculomyces boomerangus]PWA01415.1 hypothetical protein BB558_002489 [Smittium angustum]
MTKLKGSKGGKGGKVKGNSHDHAMKAANDAKSEMQEGLDKTQNIETNVADQAMPTIQKGIK